MRNTKERRKGNAGHFMRHVLCLLLFISLAAGRMPETVKAQEASAAKKIISIVYDDSGSMVDPNASWASANYAMQAFAALLNVQDEMYITYMSDVGNGSYVPKTVDLSDVAAAVTDIREDVAETGGTPLDAVDVAMNQLLSVQESDESVQFWLVILTDGSMSSFGAAKYTTLEETLDNYAGATMSNGSSVYISYMGIGASAVRIQEDSSRGLASYQAGTDIVPVLSDIANKISGRLKFESGQISQTDGKTIKVHSDIPMYTISVFSQSSNATVSSVKSEADLTIDRNVPLKYPEKPNANTNTSLFGNAAVVNNGSGVIPAGDYRITFSEDVNLANVVVMYQPAIKMKAVMTRNGIEVDDPSMLAAGDEVDIEIIPTDPDTGDEIDEKKLPEGISWKVSYEVDGTAKAEKDGKLLSDVKVEDGNNKVTASMLIPDYVPMIQTISFTPEKAMVYGIQVYQPEKSEFARNNLGIKNVDGELVKFQITGDGAPLTKEQQDGLKLKVKDVSADDSGIKEFYNRLGFKSASVGLKFNEDGTYSLYPRNFGFPAFLIKAGTYTVTVALENDTAVTAEGTFEVVPSLADWIDLIKVAIFLLIVFYLIYIFFIKAKFDGQTLKIEVYMAKGALGEGKLMTTESEEVVLKKFGKDLFLPKGACTKLVGGVRVIADGCGGAYIKKSTVLNYDAFGNSAGNPLRNFSGVCAGLKKVQGNEDKITAAVSLGAQAFYLKQGTRLYRITLH